MRHLVALLLTACIACDSQPDSPLQAIANEPLQAGVGLGSLKLAQTTLGAFTRQFGTEQAAVTTDSIGAKIDFTRAGLSFLFRGDSACAHGLAAAQDANAYLLQNPQCETMLLESIAAYIPATGEPLYEGETVEGIGLNAARELAERSYAATQQAVSALESGTALPADFAPPSVDELRQPGIRIYLGKDAKGREVVRKLEVIRPD